MVRQSRTVTRQYYKTETVVFSQRPPQSLTHPQLAMAHAETRGLATIITGKIWQQSPGGTSAREKEQCTKRLRTTSGNALCGSDRLNNSLGSRRPIRPEDSRTRCPGAQKRASLVSCRRRAIDPQWFGTMVSRAQLWLDLACKDHSLAPLRFQTGLAPYVYKTGISPRHLGLPLSPSCTDSTTLSCLTTSIAHHVPHGYTDRDRHGQQWQWWLVQLHPELAVEVKRTPISDRPVGDCGAVGLSRDWASCGRPNTGWAHAKEHQCGLVSVSRTGESPRQTVTLDDTLVPQPAHRRGRAQSRGSQVQGGSPTYSGLIAGYTMRFRA